MASKIKPKSYRELLPLAARPKGSQDMAAWVPFQPSGDSLGDIIDRYNQWIMDTLRGWSWSDEYIQYLGMFINILNYDLSEAANLEKDRYKKIGIVVLDVDDTQGKDKDLDAIKVQMTWPPADLISYNLTLLSKITNMAPPKRYFELLPIWRSQPEILPDQKSFEDWLRNLAIMYHQVMRRITPPDVGGWNGKGGPGGGRTSADESIRKGAEVYEEYINKPFFGLIDIENEWEKTFSYEAYLNELPKLVAFISDRSLATGIPFDQAVEDAQSALTAEYGLRRLAAELETPEHPKIVIDALRPSLAAANLRNQYAELLENRPESIIALNLNRPVSRLNRDQRQEISDLGVSGQDEIILQFNQEKIRKRVHSLGGILDVTNLQSRSSGSISGKKLLDW